MIWPFVELNQGAASAAPAAVFFSLTELIRRKHLARPLIQMISHPTKLELQNVLVDHKAVLLSNRGLEIIGGSFD